MIRRAPRNRSLPARASHPALAALAVLAVLAAAWTAALAPAAAGPQGGETPPLTTEGSFVGTWYYVDPAFRIAIFVEPDRTGLMTVRYKLLGKSGVTFETDAGGIARYLDEGVAVEFLFTGTPSADGTTIEGRMERSAVAKNDSSVESGRFRIYRTSQGRAIVLHYPEFESRVTDSSGRTKTTTRPDVTIVFRKASDIVIDFSEIPF